MLVRVQMLLTEFIVTITLRAVTENKIIPILLSSSADSTLMLSSVRSCRCLDVFLVDIPAVHFLRGESFHISCSEIEQDKIKHGYNDAHSRSPYKL